MAGQIIIKLNFNKETGKKDIGIKYDSDDDALAYEHEARHRQIVEQLLGQGILQPDEVGKVLVERVSTTEAAPTPNQSPASPEPQKQSS